MLAFPAGEARRHGCLANMLSVQFDLPPQISFGQNWTSKRWIAPQNTMTHSSAKERGPNEPQPQP